MTGRVPLETVRELATIYAEIPTVACRGLCQASCCPIGDFATPVERARIEAKAGYAMNGAAARAGGEPCNMLSPTGTCSVYNVRPTVCRLYGVDEGMRCPHGCLPSIPEGAGMEFVRRVAGVK